MKKLLVLLILFLLAGCSREKLENIEIDRNHYAPTSEWQPIGLSENGLYYIKDEILYYKANHEEVVPLGYVDYIDGEKKRTNNTSYKYEVRVDYFEGRDLICYGDRIFMRYYTTSYDGGSYYQLASVDLKGEDFKTHIIFDYVPQRIVMNNGKVYVMYLNHETNEEYIEIYNSNFELVHTEYYESDKNVMDFYVENGELIVPDKDVLYENESIKILNKVEIIDDYIKTEGIAKIGEKEIIFENKSILFVNDKYFYVCSDESPQTFERYYLNGELDQSILISDYIKSEGTINNLFEMDFSYMLKLKNEDVVYGYSNPHSPRFFEVNFEERSCNYVDE